MDTTDLTSPEFWDSDTCHVMVNDRDAGAVAQSETLRSWCSSHNDLQGHLLFATSGSTGEGKWVALSRRAILASARAVNVHLNATENDHWLLALPTFHVGGIGIIARAHLASCGMSVYDETWDAAGFHKALAQGVTLTSLVPTQLHDLVSLGFLAPTCLRAVLIGGGALDDKTYQKAIGLGWPVMETYGMTEACSQIATAGLSDRKLKILPCWQTRIETGGNLSIKGAPLLTCYLKVNDGQVRQDSPLTDGWFTTSDRAEIENDYLVFRGRSDRCVKVLGELVDLAGVETKLQTMLGDIQVAVIALPDDRKSNRLVLCAEQAGDARFKKTLDDYNLTCVPVARVESVSWIDEIPRSDLGKVRYSELTQRIADKN